MTAKTKSKARFLGPKLRREKIAEAVRRHGKVSVEQLALRFKTSHETIRRDLAALAETGSIQKFHGGAKLPGRQEEGPFRERMVLNAVAKRVIAEKTARLIAPGDTIFIDTGSTTLMCAEEIAKIGGLTVITNSTRIAAVMSGGGNRTVIFLLGGRFDGDNQETVGPTAISEIQSFHADHALITIGALDAAAGATDFNFDEAQVARAMMENADNLIVVADASKFQRRAAFAVCPLERIGALVCDRVPAGALAGELAAAGVSVH
ncbi:DeoR/GlpR family DNA-binding transcription regulator [Pelagibius sp. CAU 1746]|uniref:DeoR/GlpR family DNA-binding transcription regulator n=1 Tax=Pelagibius sp. CAU 1746 TaxID=3140370 RepID=UPI00325A82E1